MVCKICGKELPKGSTVCPYCGAKNAVPGSKHRKSKKAKKRQRIVSVIVIVLAMLILAAVVYGVVRMVQKLSAAADPDDSYVYEPQAENTGSGATKDKKDNAQNQDSSTPQEKNDTENEAAPSDAGNTAQSEQSGDPEQGEEKQDDPSKTDVPGEPEHEDTPKPEEPEPEEPAPVQTKYTLYVSKEETTATLRHYREIKYSINEPLERGVTIKKVEWLPDDPSICHAEEVAGVCRLWGDKYGKTNVILRITLSDGTVVERTIAFTCAENQPENNSSDNTGGGATLGDSNYILKNSDTRIYTEDELKTLSKHDLMLARNEIYARHGYIFSDSELKAYFEGKSWYHGTNTKETFDYSCLNSTESQNVKNIRAVEATK